MPHTVRTLARRHPQSSPALSALQFALAVLVGDMALALSAHLQVPFWPVPMTMETFAVLSIGVFCAPALAMSTVGAFLVEGIIGLPVFAHGGGPAYLLGPTGGYLAGYLLAAGLVSVLIRRGWHRSAPRLLMALVAGDALIFAAGFAWLSLLIGPEKAWIAGVAPFLLADGLKIALVAATARVGARWLKAPAD